MEFWHLGLKMDCISKSLPLFLSLPHSFSLPVPPTHPAKSLLFQAVSLDTLAFLSFSVLPCLCVEAHCVAATFSFLPSLPFVSCPNPTSPFPCSLTIKSLVERLLLCSVCLNLHQSSLGGVSSGLLIKSYQLMTAFIPHLDA